MFDFFTLEKKTVHDYFRELNISESVLKGNHAEQCRRNYSKQVIRTFNFYAQKKTIGYYYSSF